MRRVLSILSLPFACVGLFFAVGSGAAPPAEACDMEGASCTSPYDEEDDDEGEEAPALTLAEARAIEAAVWAHIEEEMDWHQGVYRVAGIWDRHLVPIWVEAPEPVDEELFEVAVEFMAVQAAPSDFPTSDEAGVPPRQVPRTVEQRIRAQSRIRSPLSWQLTFEVQRIRERLRIVGVAITGRPGETRAPWRSTG